MKKWLLALVAVLLLAAVPLVVFATGIIGDANGDEAVNVTDAMLILRYAVRKIDTDQLDITVCDVNGDGKVNTSDAMTVLRYAVRKITKFPIEDMDGPTPPPHAHRYTAVVTPPTAETEGYTTYTCECGYSFTGNFVPSAVTIGGQEISLDATEVTVKAATPAELAAALPNLRLVKAVTVEDPIADHLDMLALVEQFPDIAFSYCLDLFGLVVSNTDTELILSGAQIPSVQAFEQYMPHFTNLQKVEMCQCGISDEEMDALNRRYPDIPIIWEVKIGDFFLRTDVTYFMPYQHSHLLTDADADSLRYLTELIVLDVGHMEITRTDYLAYMTKLEYLLMCDCPIKDLTPVAGLKNLKFADFFITPVTDFSPLVNCTSLVDLNLCYTNPKDPMVFTQMPWLEHLWMRGVPLRESQMNKLRQALPNTRFLFGEKGGSTGSGWRNLPNYYAQRDILGMPYMEAD